MDCIQHTRLPYPSLSPGVCSNACPLSRWYYLNISSSATSFSFCLQSFPASVSFPMSHFLYQVVKVLELQLQHQSFQWIFRLIWIGLFDLLAVQGTLKSLIHHHSSKAAILQCSAFLIAQLSHPYITIGKAIALSIRASITLLPKTCRASQSSYREGYTSDLGFLGQWEMTAFTNPASSYTPNPHHPSSSPSHSLPPPTLPHRSSF